MDERIQLLLDKQDIHETLMRYFRGVDRNDVELIRSAFHPDGLFELGPHKVRGAELGEDKFKGLGRWEATMHVAANQTIAVSGDRAVAETYALNHHLIDRDGQDFLMVRYMRYVDRFERRDGDWRISHRQVMCEWSRIDAITEKSAGFPEYAQPQRSRADLSYLLDRV